VVWVVVVVVVLWVAPRVGPCCKALTPTRTPTTRSSSRGRRCRICGAGRCQIPAAP
jgi:hypothetical protein